MSFIKNEKESSVTCSTVYYLQPSKRKVDLNEKDDTLCDDEVLISANLKENEVTLIKNRCVSEEFNLLYEFY
jgi:hypothetical protein